MDAARRCSLNLYKYIGYGIEMSMTQTEASKQSKDREDMELDE